MVTPAFLIVPDVLSDFFEIPIELAAGGTRQSPEYRTAQAGEI
jgi:hypothetical protein